MPGPLIVIETHGGVSSTGKVSSRGLSETLLRLKPSGILFSGKFIARKGFDLGELQPKLKKASKEAPVGCAPDLIESGKTGYVFCSGSVDELARAIQIVIRLEGKDVRQACREKIVAYSFERAAHGITEAYFQVATRESLL